MGEIVWLEHTAEMPIEYFIDQSAEEDAERKGCYIVLPESNELFIDIDNEEQFQLFTRRFDELCRVCNYVLTWECKPSKSGGEHRHIVVNANKDFDMWERIALQFALGSDPVRETLSTLRAAHGIENPTKFFEPLEKKI
jgi:hypothetical protein